MEIRVENVGKGFVVIPLEEYERLKTIERDAHELWEQRIKNILEGANKR